MHKVFHHNPLSHVLNLEGTDSKHVSWIFVPLPIWLYSLSLSHVTAVWSYPVSVLTCLKETTVMESSCKMSNMLGTE